MRLVVVDAVLFFRHAIEIHSLMSGRSSDTVRRSLRQACTVHVHLKRCFLELELVMAGRALIFATLTRSGCPPFRVALRLPVAAGSPQAQPARTRELLWANSAHALARTHQLNNAPQLYSYLRTSLRAGESLPTSVSKRPLIALNSTPLALTCDPIGTHGLTRSQE